MPEWMNMPEWLEPKLVVLFVLIGTVLFLAHRGSRERPGDRQGRTAAMLKNLQR